MAVVSAEDMVRKAKAGHYAVGAFNIHNMEFAKATLLAAEELRSPVILAVSEESGEYMTGFGAAADMAKSMVRDMGITVPVALHLDHGSYEGCKACIEAGFTSVMFDGSALPFEENVRKTAELLALAKKYGVSLEAEVGAIGEEEDQEEGKSGECADPEECRKMAELGITMLAAGIGNIHGIYPEGWEGLKLGLLYRISEQTGDLPLVLHGGTGIPEDQIRQAIFFGVSKINVSTECQVVFAQGTRQYIEEGRDLRNKGFDPRKMLVPGTEAIKEKVMEKMRIFGSAGKADV